MPHLRGGLALTLFTLLLLNGKLSAQEKTKTDSLVFTRFYSAMLGEERKIVTHLPLNYFLDSSKKYPIMYVLDAGKLDFEVSDRLFALSSAGLSQEAIVVGILNNKGTRERDLTPPFMQVEVEDTASPFGKGDQFLKFIQQELIPRIDSTYRTSGYQTISGHSRGGLFVLYTLLEHPGLFHARFCYSTPAWRFDNRLIRRIEENLLKLRELSGSYLFYSVGEKENANILSAFHRMNTLEKRMKSIKMKYDSYLTPFGDHQTNPVLSVSRALYDWSKWIKRIEKK